jgi:predicted RNA-binding Zn-ribbon protein involved in translation (DUF1610 family)
MGKFTDFREVFKELKHKKRGEVTIKLCPKCASSKILISSGFDTYPRLFGITPRYYICPNCGYKGPIILEQTKKEDNTG